MFEKKTQREMLLAHQKQMNLLYRKYLDLLYAGRKTEAEEYFRRTMNSAHEVLIQGEKILTDMACEMALIKDKPMPKPDFKIDVKKQGFAARDGRTFLAPMWSDDLETLN